MRKQAVGIVFVFGLLVVSALAKAQAEAPQIVDLALTAIGAGSAEEIKGRLFTARITRHDAAYRTAALAALSGSIRNQRITEGRLLRRVERAIRPALELHYRSDSIDVALVQDDKPYAMLWRECVLVLSSGLAAALADRELRGIVAHELGHSYFIGELALAREAGDKRGMKVIELKCDAVAMVTLKLLGDDPADLLRSLRKIDRVKQSMLLWDRPVETHPSTAERGQFTERFSKLLTQRGD